MATAESMYAIYSSECNSATLGAAPDDCLTPVQADLREVVDDMFAYSDAVTNSIMHAIHAKSNGDPYWLPDRTTGIWRQATEDERAAMVVEEAAQIDAKAREAAKETGELVVASVVEPEQEGARIYLFPLKPGWDTEQVAANS